MGYYNPWTKLGLNIGWNAGKLTAEQEANIFIKQGFEEGQRRRETFNALMKR